MGKDRDNQDWGVYCYLTCRLVHIRRFKEEAGARKYHAEFAEQVKDCLMQGINEKRIIRFTKFGDGIYVDPSQVVSVTVGKINDLTSDSGSGYM